jgi:hypothetical protein
MSLLNAHPKVRCDGEIFNPNSLIMQGAPQQDDARILTRDTFPKAFLEKHFIRQTEEDPKALAVGSKYMIGHHPEVYDFLRARPDIRLIYVYRENKLAQTASLLKALQTKKWATRNPLSVDRTPIPAWPRNVAMRVREQQTTDLLFQNFLAGMPNPSVTFEYREMFQPGFKDSLCQFLDVPSSRRMKSWLVKQGDNNILARFEHSKAIAEYFTAIGKGDWLEPEL